MNVIDIDLDKPDDDDVFVLKHVKPINKLTVQQALLIKHNVLLSVKSNNNNSKRTDKIRQTETKERKKCGVKDSTSKKSKLKEEVGVSVENGCGSNLIIAQKGKNVGDPEHCASGKRKLHSDGPQDFISAKLHPTSSVLTMKDKEQETVDFKQDLIQLSPGIAKRRKKYNILENSFSTSTPKKGSRSGWSPVKSQNSPFKGFKENAFTVKQNTNIELQSMLSHENNFELKLDSVNLTTDEQDRHFVSNSELLHFLMKKIISEVTKNQMFLESKSSAEGKILEKLFSVNECDILEQFCKLEGNYCKVYVRLLCRSRNWYRLSTINFKDVKEDLKEIFDVLHQHKFLDMDIHQEELITQMKLLSKGEIQKLCRTFMIPVKLSNYSKKMDLIDALIGTSQSQKCVTNMFKKGPNLSLMEVLKKEVLKYLGTCVRLNKTVKATFDKVMLLFSFPHYYDEEEKRFRNQLYMSMNLYKGFIKFPNYKVLPTVVFGTVEDFESFQTALGLQEAFEIAVLNKDYESFMQISQTILQNFKKILLNKRYIERYNHLDSFLKRFNGGHIYSRLLTKYCCKFKTKTSTKEIIDVAQILLDQNIFSISKRGKWYEILCQALESIKDNKAAAECLIKAQKDPSVDEIQKLTLQLRGQAILKKKTNGIEDVYLREVLDETCTISIQEPPSIQISGKAVQGNKSGYKSVYIENTGSGKMYTSVEERALMHYKTLGFTKGCHVEGYIVQSLFALLFFDIIYGESPAGVFQNTYQDIPLDLHSRHFYTNRKVVLDQRLQELSEWTEEEAEKMIKSVYNENFNVQCLISWKEHFTADMFCEIMKCMTLPVVIIICKRFAMNYNLAQAGFPDLTLWNPETKRCKFVEVKSPNDKLSPGQRIWLNFLRNAGIDCEVCNVKNVQRKLSL